MQKNTVLMIISFLFLNSFIFAQPTLEWIKTYSGPSNGGSVKVMAVDQNNNVIISGRNNSAGGYPDIATIKYSPSGDTQWVRRYSTGTECSSDGISVDLNGNIYVTGFTSTGGQPKAVTIKYNPAGDVLWEKLYNSTPDVRSIGVGVDNSGFVYIACNSNKDGINWGFEMVKYNPSTGDTIWTSRYDYSGNSIEIAYSMTVDGSGNVYVCGYSNSDSIRSVVIKVNNQGSLQWASLYKVPGVSGNLYGNKIRTDAYGNVYIAGLVYNGQATFVDFLVAKYNQNGTAEWVQRYSYSNAIDEAFDLAIDNSGNVFTTGKTRQSGGSNNYDYLTVKFSPAGDFIWQATYNGINGPTEDEAAAIVLDEFGDCYVTGGSSVSSFYYSGEFATVKYNGSNGMEIWSVRNSSAAFGGTCMGIDAQNNIYVAGAIGADFALIKYSQPSLPVEMTSFTASSRNIAVELIWSTSTEKNNKGFEIERRSDKSSWEKIGFAAGNGTTLQSHKYSFIDNNLKAGKYTYRLKQIDYNGSFEYSNEVEAEVYIINKYSLKQNYPNPFNPATVISYSLAAKQFVSLKIYNMLGQEIATLVNEEKEPGNYNINFDGSQISAGTYFYKLTTNGYTETKKMILLK